jgi:hypothetical protein
MKNINNKLYDALNDQFQLPLHSQLESNVKLTSSIKGVLIKKLDLRIWIQIYKQLCSPLHVQILNNI